MIREIVPVLTISAEAIGSGLGFRASIRSFDERESSVCSLTEKSSENNKSR